MLIIAPTKDYYRDPAEKEINDYIYNHEDAIDLQEKTISIVPESARKAPGNTKLKRYHDMRSIHHGSEKTDRETRQFYEDKERTKRINGVAFPVTDSTSNERYISLAYRENQ